MTKELIREALQDFARDGIHSHRNSWAAIQRELISAPGSIQIGSRRDLPTHHPLARFRSNLSLAAILIVVLVAGGAFAFLAYGNPPAHNASLSGTNTIAALQATPVSIAMDRYTVNLYPSYAPEGWLTLSYTVTDAQGNKLPLFNLTQNGLHVNARDNTMESRVTPTLVDAEGRHYPVLGTSPSFAWSNPTTDSQRTPITDVEAHMYMSGSQQGKEVCCLNTVDAVMWNFDPLSSITNSGSRSMHLNLTVFLPVDTIRSSTADIYKIYQMPGVLDWKPLDYKDTAQALLVFDFLLPAK